jgi:SWI/SNF-related matrix-associated actin-dependent regulator 1 of chromatin subfamily A
MTITETDRGFEVRFPYNPQTVAAIKTIRGAQWRAQNKFWFVPAYREREINELKKIYGIAIDPVIDMPEQVGTLAPLPTLDVDIPLNRPMYPFQTNGVAYNRLYQKNDSRR